MIEKYIKSILLVILSLSGNYFAEILGCNTQKLLGNNMAVKHILQIISIYITMNLYSSNKIHPITKLKNTLFFYVLFIMFTKMNLFFTGFVFCMILSMFIINNYIDYYKEHKKEYVHLIKINELITRVVLATLCLGVLIYFLDKKKEYSGTWDTYKYIFGVNKCKGIKT
jgi:hypothetical protein